MFIRINSALDDFRWLRAGYTDAGVLSGDNPLEEQLR